MAEPIDLRAGAGAVGADNDVPRPAVTYLIRNTQQELVALSNQCDVKGSIVITSTAVVLGVAASHFSSHDVGLSLMTLSGFLLVSMFLAIFSIVPKHRTVAVDDGFNPLFFGHYTAVPEETYLSMMADIMRDDDTVYRAQLRDLYARGTYIERAKLRYLRWSYLVFFVGFVVAAIEQAIVSAAR